MQLKIPPLYNGRKMAGKAIAAVAALDFEKLKDGWQELQSGHGRHNLILGQPRSGDLILDQQQLRKGYEFFGRVSDTYSYQCRHGEEITAVLAHDFWDDDTGGNPEKLSGGVGQNEVTIRVTSQLMRGFHFKIIVYGKK